MLERYAGASSRYADAIYGLVAAKHPETDPVFEQEPVAGEPVASETGDSTAESETHEP